mmetsp:Transcript_2422/g.4034  ORF Transcript_2422/g.4034 Transcript_2422/m.4034 type:complete len:227 (-) Transcript_2422:1-681(-)
MSQVLSYLYLGGKADAKDKTKLQKLKIKYILNCTPPRTVDPEAGCPNFYEKEKSFVYKRIPIFDNKGEDIIAHMSAAYNFIEESKHHGNILVHCHKGVSRSASFVIGYLMRKNEFTLDEAVAHVQMCRPVVNPNSSFLVQLETFQSSLITATDPPTESNSIDASAQACIGPSMPNLSAPIISEEITAPSTASEGSKESSDVARKTILEDAGEEVDSPTATKRRKIV